MPGNSNIHLLFFHLIHTSQPGSAAFTTHEKSAFKYIIQPFFLPVCFTSNVKPDRSAAKEIIFPVAIQ